MGKGGFGKRGPGCQFDKGGGKGGKSIPSAAALEHEIALFDSGGTKNEMRWSRCKHCGSQWTPFQPCTPTSFGTPGGVWSAGFRSNLPFSPFAAARGPPGSFAPGDHGGGKGGKSPGGPPKPEAPLSREEHASLAELLAKAGDAMGAAKHRELAKPPPVAKEPTLQHQVSMAHSKLRGLERKLQGAVQRFEEWSVQMVEQRALVTKFTEECEQADSEHRRLVAALHAQTSAADLQKVPEDKVVPCSLSSIMDGTFTDKLVIDPSELLGGVEDFELSEADKEELEKRGNQLREGIQKLAQRLFAQASETAKKIQAEMLSLPQTSQPLVQRQQQSSFQRLMLKLPRLQLYVSG
ncbi:unnamed protein product, partial [Prorocentrum cordatum]